MNPEDEKLLKADGWDVDCYSPFEISHEETNSSATGIGAEYVLDSIRDYVRLYGVCPTTENEFVLSPEAEDEDEDEPWAVG